MDDFYDEDGEDIATIQFGITVTEDGEPVVIMLLPDLPDEDGDPTTILIGSGTEATLFASSVLQAGKIVDELAVIIEAAGDADLSDIFAEYAQRLNAPYN